MTAAAIRRARPSLIVAAALLAALLAPPSALAGDPEAAPLVAGVLPEIAPPIMGVDLVPEAFRATAAVPAGPVASLTAPPAGPPAVAEPPAGAAAEPVETAVTPASPAPEAAAEGAERRPEEAEATPELVGPDDDRILREVEKHTTVAPEEPAAIVLAEPAYDIPLELNAKVLDYVELFQTSRRRNFEAGLVRSRKYEALMKPILREEGVPTDLFYLALIESGFNPRAYSYAHAMGIWQFISSTGRLYGLRRTSWVDERCDPDKATRAAARHLKDLHDELGSWPLVLAAYNAGKGRVQRAIAKAGTTDFWSLELPAQTRNYVPAFYAALIISKDPERYGFEVEYEEAPAVERIAVGGGTRLSLVAALCGTSIDAIKQLNPELRSSTVPPGGSYSLRIPEGSAEALVAGLTKVPPGRATAGLSGYRVAAGDTLFGIAQRFGTTVEAIREANEMRGDALRAGQNLTIPTQHVAEAPIPRAPGRVVVPASVPASYRVRKGDNPWLIARRFGLSLGDLLAWNELDEGSTLDVGRTLSLREPAAAAPRAAARGAGTTYEVRKGDNLWQIARRFETSVERLRLANGISGTPTLQVGDRLTIP